MNQEYIAKNSLMRKIKFSLIMTGVLFVLGGIWMPIVYGAEFSLMAILGSGAFIVIVSWTSIIVANVFVFKKDS